MASAAASLPPQAEQEKLCELLVTALQELARVEGERGFRQVMAFLRDSLDVDLHPQRLADGDAPQ